MLTNTINVDRYQINGTPVATYAIHYPYWDKSEIKVYLTKSDGSLETLVEGTNYTLSTPNGNDGTLTRVGDWTAGATNLTIIREMSLTQEVDYRNGDKIDAETLETSLDNLTAQVQQLSESQSRAVTSPVDEAGAGLSIPNKAARIGSGSGTIMGFGSDGDSIALRDLAGFDADVASVAADAASASASAGSASTSASTASTQALKSEGFAVGEQNGTPVTNESPYYRNNSKYYADVAASGAQVITDNRLAITSLYLNMSSVRSVANNITNVVAVDENKTNINAVNANKTNIDAVAGVASDVTTVAGVATDIPAVAGVATEIATLAPDLADVTAVADDLTKVKAVAEDLANIDAVNANKTNIDAVNANKTNIDTVAGIASDVSAVGAVASDVTAVAGSLTEIGDIATDLNDADSAIKAVASDMTGVSAVANDLANIDAVAADLANIDAADEHALEAEGWANGTQNGTPVSSGSPYYENNAKYWADAVPNLNDALTALDHRVENLEQAKGKYVVNTYKDGAITPSGKGNWAVVEGLRGVSRVENNLITNGNFESASGWSFAVGGSGSYSVADNIAKIIFGNNNSIFQIYKAGSYLGFSYTSGHTYLVFVKIRLSVNASVRVVQYETNNIHYGSNITVSANQWTLIPLLFTANASGQFETNVQSISGMSQGDIIEAKDFVVTDLSVYFGGSIPSDADTIAEIQTNYPHLLTPSEYGVRIVDSSYTGVRACGVNLFNPYAQQTTTYGTATISNDGDTISITGQYYCMFDLSLPIGSYYVRWDNGSGNTHLFRFRYKDNSITDAYGSGTTINATQEIVAIFLYCSGETTATAVYNNVQVALDASSTKTTYHRYRDPSTLSLTFQGKSAGAVADTCEPNVEVNGVAKRRDTQRIATKDLPTINWGYNSGWNCWQGVAPSDLALPSSTTVVVNALWAGMIAVRSSGFTTQSYVNTFAINPSAIFFVNNGSTTVPPSGTMQYELATPVETLSDPLIDNTLLTEAGGRMATVQTGTIVDGSFDLGFINL